MTARHPLFRLADAREQQTAELRRIADTLEKIFRILNGEAVSLTDEPAPASSSATGFLLSREGVVSNCHGRFLRPAGEIDLNRIGVGANVPGKVFAAISGSKLAGVVSVADLNTFFLSERMYSAQGFGKACRELLKDWHVQLEELLE